MTIPMPGILFGVFVSLGIFYYLNQKARIRREEKRNSQKEKHQEYLDSLLRDLKNRDPKASEGPGN